MREFTSGTRFRNGDTLLARITPCLENGKTAFVQFLHEGTVGWGSTEFIVMCSTPVVPPEFTYLLARDSRFRSEAIQSMTGTSGRQRAQAEALATYASPCSPTDSLSVFGAVVVANKSTRHRQECPTVAEPSFRRNPVVVGEDAVVPQPVVVEDPALGGQSARALRLGDPDVAEDRGIDGNTSNGWQSNR